MTTPEPDDGFDHEMRGVTVHDLRTVLRDAADCAHVVQPPALREAVALWLLAVDEQARREEWKDLLGRPVALVWNAARAILTTAAHGESRG